MFAAASLRDIFEDLEGSWRASHPGSELRIAHGASNVLAAQIAEGAPADVFVSADLARPERLATDGDAAGEVVVFARNRIALAVPRGSDRLSTPADLARPGIRIVAAADDVPITGYAKAVLTQLAATMPDPAAYTRAVNDNVVSREDNVRAALAKVELGEGDAAFVYGSDLVSAEAVREISLPVVIDITAEYGAVQVSDRPLAAEFVAWLGGDEAADVLKAAGFMSASS